MSSKVNIQAILLLFINSKVYGLIIMVSSSSTACTFTLFFAVRLSRLVLTLCNLEQYEVNTLLLCDIVKTLHVIVGFLLSVILFANQNFLDDFSIGWSVSFLLKDFAFKHIIVQIGS